MRLPSMSAGKSVSAATVVRVMPMEAETEGLDMQGCSAMRWISCGAAVAICGVTCLAGPEVCIPCLAGIGMSMCLDCLT